MRVALHQPNFLPHAGFFLKWMAADHLLRFDSAQLPDRGFTARTKVLLGGETSWLSLPVSGKRLPINAARLSNDQPWRRKLLGSLERIWAEANGDLELLKQLIALLPETPEFLCELNLPLLAWLGETLEIPTPTSLTSEIEATINPDVDARIIDLVKSVGGTSYLSGPSGRNYLDSARFSEAGLRLEFFSYSTPEYSQASEDFVAGLSVVDILANLHAGGALAYLQSAKTRVEPA